MIISHRLKFAFFANQRTGSKAVGLVLRLSNIFDENDIMIAQPFPATRTAQIELPAYNLGEHDTTVVNHMTPQATIDAGFITLEQLREYNCYAILRDPEQRFFAVRASMQIDRYGNVAMPGRRKCGIAPAQHEFFFVGDEQVVTTLDFDNFHDELEMLVESLGGTKQMDIPDIFRTSRKPYMVHEVEFNRGHHTKDLQLFSKMKNAA